MSDGLKTAPQDLEDLQGTAFARRNRCTPVTFAAFVVIFSPSTYVILRLSGKDNQW
jgi:hypothetical protein